MKSEASSVSRISGTTSIAENVEESASDAADWPVQYQ